MKTPLVWMLKVTLLLWSWLLVACAADPAPVKPAAAKETQAGAGAAATIDTPGVPSVVVPGPDGQARVLVTARGTALQRRPDAPLELLDTPADDVEEYRWAEKAKELAEGVRWSASGARVCLLQTYKRGSGVAVFSLAAQPAAAMDLKLDVLEKAVEKRYGDKFKMGRFYYIALKRWIDEDHLEIEVSGNLLPRVETVPEMWGYYSGTTCVELGPKSGTVQGEIQWKPLTMEVVR